MKLQVLIGLVLVFAGLKSFAMGQQLPGNLRYGSEKVSDYVDLKVLKNTSLAGLQLRAGQSVPVYIKIYSGFVKDSKGELQTANVLVIEKNGQSYEFSGSQIRARVGLSHSTGSPTVSQSTESCSLNESERICFRDSSGREQCGDRTVTRTGIRTVETTTSYSSAKYDIYIMSGGQAVARVKGEGSNSDTSTREIIPCH